MTRLTIRRHLIQLKFERPRYVLPSERIHVQAEPPLKIISIIIGLFALLTCPVWIPVAFGAGIMGALWLITQAPWLAALLGFALIVLVFHGIAWQESAYRYWVYRMENRIESLLEKLGLIRAKEGQ